MLKSSTVLLIFHWLNILLTEWGLKFLIIFETKMDINTCILRLYSQRVQVQDCYILLANCFFYLSVIIINKWGIFFQKFYLVPFKTIFFLLFQFLVMPSKFSFQSFQIVLLYKVLEILLLLFVISCVSSFLSGFLWPWLCSLIPVWFCKGFCKRFKSVPILGSSFMLISHFGVSGSAIKYKFDSLTCKMKN